MRQDGVVEIAVKSHVVLHVAPSSAMVFASSSPMLSRHLPGACYQQIPF
jgi:hypothetical protein